MSIPWRPWMALAVLSFSSALYAQLENETELKLRAGGFMQDNPSLSPDGDEQRRASEFFGEIHGSLFTRYGSDISTKIRIQAFSSTGEVFLNSDDTPKPSDGYIALREAWIDIGALTSFPGEVIRIGRQRIRQDDALWYDDDALGLEWSFDTTLLQWKLAAVQQVEGFRTDDADIENQQRDRPYFLASLGGQYRPNHFVGVRLAHAQDRFDLEDEDAEPAEERRDRERRFTWAGVHLHNNYHDYRQVQHFGYWMELVNLRGDQRVAERPAPGSGLPTTINEQDVDALAGVVAFRVRPRLETPFQFGAVYSHGEGGQDGATSRQYEQTGLHSNRARLTGTRTQIERFSGAAQYQLNNLSAVTGFIAFPGQRFELSLLAHRFRRVQSGAAVVADGLSATPTVDDDDLGTALDAVFSIYLDGFQRTLIRDQGPAGEFRLRFSHFQPGAAYGPDADASYRAILETSWRI